MRHCGFAATTLEARQNFSRIIFFHPQGHAPRNSQWDPLALGALASVWCDRSCPWLTLPAWRRARWRAGCVDRFHSDRYSRPYDDSPRSAIIIKRSLINHRNFFFNQMVGGKRSANLALSAVMPPPKSRGSISIAPSVRPPFPPGGRPAPSRFPPLRPGCPTI
jgi:hypothetical protein